MNSYGRRSLDRRLFFWPGEKVKKGTGDGEDDAEAGEVAVGVRSGRVDEEGREEDEWSREQEG
jgi:hypothetical protein